MSKLYGLLPPAKETYILPLVRYYCQEFADSIAPDEHIEVS